MEEVNKIIQRLVKMGLPIFCHPKEEWHSQVCVGLLAIEQMTTMESMASANNPRHAGLHRDFYLHHDNQPEHGILCHGAQ